MAVRLGLHSRRAIAAVTLLAVLGAAAIAASPAGASLGLACPSPTSQVFLAWGDPSFYSAVPNGGFENAADGWTLSGGARVVGGNEPWQVGGAGDSHSLALPPGSSATTPPMCVSVLSGHMRFFAVNGGDPSSRLRVQVVYGGGLGSLVGQTGSLLGLSDVASIAAPPTWQLSPWVTMLGGVLPIGTQFVQFRFTPADARGSWTIDDLYLDPLMQG